MDTMKLPNSLLRQFLRKTRLKHRRRENLTNKLNLVPRKAKVDEIQSISKKPKEGQEPKHFDDEELNRLVPFADLFPLQSVYVRRIGKRIP